MKKTLFVAGLDYSINDNALKDLFAQHGTVTSAKVIMDKFTNRSKGFGFVDMATAEEATTAIQKLNDATVMNRTLVVKHKEDKPAGSRPPSRNGSSDRRW